MHYQDPFLQHIHPKTRAFSCGAQCINILTSNHPFPCYISTYSMPNSSSQQVASIQAFFHDSTQPKKLALRKEKSQNGRGGGGGGTHHFSILSNAFQGQPDKKWVGTPGPPLPKKSLKYPTPGSFLCKYASKLVPQGTVQKGVGKVF